MINAILLYLLLRRLLQQYMWTLNKAKHMKMMESKEEKMKCELGMRESTNRLQLIRADTE